MLQGAVEQGACNRVCAGRLVVSRCCGLHGLGSMLGAMQCLVQQSRLRPRLC